MDIYILNTDFEIIGLIDYCASIIWTRRYCQAGDFELYIPVTKEALELLQTGNLAMRADAPESLMVIQNLEVKTDSENGNFITATGASIESYIAKRIVWSQTNLAGTVAQAIEQLLSENIINPTNTARKIAGITMEATTVGTEEIKKQITGDNLLDAIIGILNTYSLGFKLVFTNGALVFQLYKGTDRSYNQEENPRVVFSPEFDNFKSSEYKLETAQKKTVALVAGEGEGSARKTQEVGTASGLERIELYVDARDISSTTGDGTLTPAEYNTLLISKGEEQLAEATALESYSGEVEPNTGYIYGTDYHLGDIVETINEYGQAQACRITEIIESWDENGYSAIPTFDSKEVSE